MLETIGYIIGYCLAVAVIIFLLIIFIKEYQKERKEKEFLLNTLSAINKDIYYIRKEIENVSKEL